MSRKRPGLGPGQHKNRTAMPRRFPPTQLAAAVIIGIAVALVVLILYHRVWL
jgi:hypothetical protein